MAEVQELEYFRELERKMAEGQLLVFGSAELMLEELNAHFLTLNEEWKLLDEEAQLIEHNKKLYLDAQSTFYQAGMQIIAKIFASMSIADSETSEGQEEQSATLSQIVQEAVGPQPIESSSDEQRAIDLNCSANNSMVNDEKMIEQPQELGLPDISSLSFQDHGRVLKPILTLQPIQSISERAINEIVVSLIEVNERANEDQVSIESQHRLLMIYVHSLLDVTSQQIFNWQMMDGEPSWDEFIQFLTKRAKNIGPSEQGRSSAKSEHTNPPQMVSNYGGNSAKQLKLLCFWCNRNDHVLIHCIPFKNQSTEVRERFVEAQRLCYNCFSITHQVDKCNKGACRWCQTKHNSLLPCPGGAQGGK